MIIAIATTGDTLDSPCDPRFGRAGNFLLIDSDTEEIIDTIKNPNIASGGGAGISTSQMLANRGVNAVIAGAVGPNSFGVLDAAQIAMYSSAGFSTAKDAYSAFKSGELKRISNPGSAGRFH
ncbi:NifB/NifX family molybdenum-iron cluster-binding protein [bacterium]|nr:NifB/NifX family molybdenum-iron cluster-binding protein [bacterium]